jgi:Uma2 family endonuclease
VLAVEVLSPSGRLIDLNLKRAAYQRIGTPSYWVLDPEAHQPFKVRVVPTELLGRLWSPRAESRRWWIDVMEVWRSVFTT